MACELAGIESLWERLDHEVQRLTSERTKGKHFSEDFVVDRVCTLLSRLRQQYDESSREVVQAPNGEEELTRLRANLAAEELTLKEQRAEMDSAYSQLQEAKDERAELDKEWEAAREQQRMASDKHARTWKETALRSQLCQARLKAMQQEEAQLGTALSQPEMLSKEWDSLITNLQAELNVASNEAAEATREHDRLLAECLRADRRRATASRASAAGQIAVVDNAALLPKPQLTLSSAQPAPVLNATSAAFGVAKVGMANALPTRPGTTLRSPSAQLSLQPEPTSASTAEASGPFSTTSILNDAKRALEKLEQLKVRRVGATGSASYTGPAPSGPGPMRSAGGSAASVQVPEGYNRSVAAVPQTCVHVAKAATVGSQAPRAAPLTPVAARTPAMAPSPQTSAQAPVVRRLAASPMSQPQSSASNAMPSSASNFAATPKAAAALPLRAQAGIEASPAWARASPAAPARGVQLAAPMLQTPDGASRMHPARAPPMSTGQAVSPAPTLSSVPAGPRIGGVPQEYSVARPPQPLRKG